MRGCKGCILTVPQDCRAEVGPYANGSGLPHLMVCLEPCDNHYDDVGSDCGESGGKTDCVQWNIRSIKRYLQHVPSYA